MSTVQDRMFDRPDGSQVLVSVMGDGRLRVAERPGRFSSWGPPLESFDDASPIRDQDCGDPDCTHPTCPSCVEPEL
jgi:hypothetical protein